MRKAVAIRRRFVLLMPVVAERVTRGEGKFAGRSLA